MTTKDCLSCAHSAPATAPDGRIDFSKKICVEGPPTPMTVLGPNNTPMMIAFFPTVGKGVYCHRWEPNGVFEGAEAEEDKAN